MWLIIAVVTVSLIGSFLCSLCEAALYGVTPTQVEVLRRGRIPGSDRLAKLRRRIDEPITGIAAFNSVAQTVGAAWTGALVGELYGNAWLGPFSAVLALSWRICWASRLWGNTICVLRCNTWRGSERGFAARWKTLELKQQDARHVWD